MQLDLFGAQDATAQEIAPPREEPTRSKPSRRAARERDADRLARALIRRTRLILNVTLTDNSSNMMSMKIASNGKEGTLRIHHMFADAPPQVLDALAAWLTKHRSRKAGRIVDEYIRDHTHLIRESRARSVRLRTRGIWHDLRKLFREVNDTHFENKVDSVITWGRMPTILKRRSIRLGSYTPEDNLVRIHPLLDQEFVPDFFVRFIVFHEMLHAVVGVEVTESGRRSVHSKRFRRLERAYPDYARSIAWHDDPKNLRKLLRGGPKVTID